MGDCVALKLLDEGVGSIEIMRPEALNALNTEVLKELNLLTALLSGRRDLSVIILRSAGEKAFVAGADIKEMLNFTQRHAFEFSRFGQNVFRSISELPQIVIAQVQGFALGGGLELALSADFIIASQKAKFGLPEVGLGLIPGFGGTQRLVMRLGYARALEWMTSAEKYSAEAAFQLGLLNRVTSAEELSQTVDSLARTIASQGPEAVFSAKQCAKAAMLASGELGFETEARFFGQCFSGQEAREGLSAFVEKRRPQFPREIYPAAAR